MPDLPIPRRSPAQLLTELPDLRIEQDAYNINVTANYGDPIDAREVDQVLRHHPGAGRPLHLYFHVPLCAYVCHFCNYVKKLHRGGSDELDTWTAALVRESEATAARAPWLGSARVESAYLGGGTAAVLEPQHLERLMAHVHDTYRLSDDVEITLEGNPDNFTDAEGLARLRGLGINRFSVGVQSLEARVTAFTNRRHTPEMSRRAMAALRDTGLPFNVDLMFGLPLQSLASVIRDIETVLAHEVPTITIYRLRNADRAAMGIGNRASWNVPAVRDRLHASGAFPSVEQTYEMREAVVDRLLDAGYRPSPCGWWNRPGTYPEGNIPRVSRNKWQRHDSMVAFGPGAYGWLCADGEVVQTYHDTDIAAHLRSVTTSEGPWLSHGRRLRGARAIATTLGFNFKAAQPILLDHYRERYQVDLAADEPYRSVFQELTDAGLLERRPGGWGPTLDGETFHEEIITLYFHRRLGGFEEAVCKRVGA